MASHDWTVPCLVPRHTPGRVCTPAELLTGAHAEREACEGPQHTLTPRTTLGAELGSAQYVASVLGSEALRRSCLNSKKIGSLRTPFNTLPKRQPSALTAQTPTLPIHRGCQVRGGVPREQDAAGPLHHGQRGVQDCAGLAKGVHPQDARLLHQDGCGHLRCLRGDHHRCEALVRDDRRRYLALPRHQRQRLRHQVQGTHRLRPLALFELFF